MVLPADAVGQAGHDGLIDQEVVQAVEQRPRHQRDQRHPQQRAAMFAEERRAGHAARHVHDGADEAEQRHFHQRHAEADHQRGREYRPHLAQIEHVETPDRGRRRAVHWLLEGIDQRFEPAEDHRWIPGR